MALTKVKGHIVADDIALGGNPTTTTQSASDNSTKLATTAYVTTAVSNLVDGAPSTLNTLNEIAAALNDDAALNTTLTNSIATKLPLAGGTMTGHILLNNAIELRSKDTSSNIKTIARVNNSNQLEYGWSGSGPVKFMGGGSYTERMRIHTNGNIGIGETSPDAPLHITSNTPIISFDESDASQEFRIGSFGGAFALYDSTDSAYRFTVDGSGNLGLGTTSPDDLLHIKGTDTSTSDTFGLRIHNASFTTNTIAGILFQNADNNNAYIRSIRSGSSSGILTFGTNTGGGIAESNISERMRIDSSGNLMVGTTGTASAKTVINVNGSGTQAVLLLNNAHGYGSGVGTASTALQFSRDTSPTNGQAVIGAQIHSGNEAETTSNPQNLIFSTKAGASPYNLTEAMRINSSQQLVIGATAPYAGTKLDVRGGNIMVGGYNGGTDYGLILTPDDTSGYWNIANITGGHLTFNNSNTIGSSEKMRIDTSGRLLAGTTTAGARTAHTLARTGAFAAEILQQQTSAGASVLGLTYDGAAPNNTTDYFIYARDTAGIKYRLHANGSSEQVGNITTTGQVISNHMVTSDAGHNTARFEARYDDQNSTNPQYNGNMLMWVSEPGLSYDSGGIGTNVHPSGQYYGRRYNYGYSTYMRFLKSSGIITFNNNQGTSGTAGASQTEMLRIEQAGNLRLAVNAGVGFGATTAANLLDDYEEGTWTPTFSGATLSTASGRYTKIGNQVTVHYHLVTSGGLPSSGTPVQVGGLPFTSSTSTLSAGSIYARYYSPNDSTLTSIIFDNESVIKLVNINEGSFDYTLMGELEGGGANNSIYAIGTMTYQV